MISLIVMLGLFVSGWFKIATAFKKKQYIYIFFNLFLHHCARDPCLQLNPHCYNVY